MKKISTTDSFQYVFNLFFLFIPFVKLYEFYLTKFFIAVSACLQYEAKMYWRYSFDNSYYHLWEPPTQIVTDFTERYYKGTFELYNMETIYTFNFTFSKEGDFMIKINDNIIFKDKSSGNKDFLIQGRYSSLKEGTNTIWIEQHGNSLNKTDFVPHSITFNHQPDLYTREYVYRPSNRDLQPLSEEDVLRMRDNQSETSYIGSNRMTPFNFTFYDDKTYSMFTYIVMEPNKCDDYPRNIIIYGVIDGEIHPEAIYKTTLGCSVNNKNKLNLPFEAYNRIYSSYMLSVLSTQTCSTGTCNVEIGELRFYMENREPKKESNVNVAAAVTIPVVVVVILVIAIVVWLYYEAEFATWLPGSKAYKNKKREEEIERMMKEPESTELLSDNNNNNISISNNRNIPPPAPPLHHPRREFIEKEYNKKIEEEGYNLAPEERQRQQEKKHKRIIELKRQNLQICSDLLRATSSKLLSISELIEKPNESQLTILSDFVKLCGYDSSKLMVGNSGGYSWYKLKKLFDEELIEKFEKIDPFKVNNPPSLSNLMHINVYIFLIFLIFIVERCC